MRGMGAILFSAVALLALRAGQSVNAQSQNANKMGNTLPETDDAFDECNRVVPFQPSEQFILVENSINCVRIVNGHSGNISLTDDTNGYTHAERDVLDATKKLHNTICPSKYSELAQSCASNEAAIDLAEKLGLLR